MAYVACLTEIRKATGLDNLSDDEAEGFLKSVLSTAERIRQERSLSSDEALSAAAKELADNERIVAERQRFNALQDLQKRINRRGRITSEGPAGIVDGIRAELHGTNTPREGTAWRYGVQQEWHANAKDWVARGVTAELDRAGLYKAAQGGKLDDDVAAEMWELSNKESGKPGISGNAQAKTIAAIYNRYMDVARKSLNDAGAWVGSAANYVAHTAHDMDAIRRAGKEKWLTDTAPLLDPKTFDGVADPAEFLSNVYEALSSGVHLSIDGQTGFKGPAFSGPGSLAGKLSESRVLQWRDSSSWRQYQKSYGEPNLTAAVLTSLERSARAAALLKRYGTNPEVEFANDMRWARETYRGADPISKGWETGLDNRFGELTGKNNMAVMRGLASFTRYHRLLDATSLLGNVLFTHLSVGMTRAAELWHHGINPLEAYGNFVSSAIRGAGRSDESRAMMQSLGAGADGATEKLLNRFDLDEGLPGVASTLTGAFMRATGLRYLYDAERGGMEWMLSHNLGRSLDTGFGDLHPGLQKMLGGYGLGAREWDLIRAASARTSVNGRVFLTARDALNISDEAATGYLGDKATPHSIEALRNNLARQLDGYFTDSAERGMIQPGVETRAIMLRGTKPGTPQGEILRYLSQFHVWPAELIRGGLGREIYTSANWEGAAVGVTHMAVAGMAFGYLRMVAADLTAGKTPRDPRDPKTWVAALAQGGGLGLLGDLAFGQVLEDRFGNSPLVSVLGPGAADVETLMKAAAKAKAGGNPTNDLLTALVHHIPFANLFYTKLAVDYGLIWRMNEMMRPGWSRRYQAKVEHDSGQKFWLPPASVR